MANKVVYYTSMYQKYVNIMTRHISDTEKLIEIHRKSYESLVDGGILLDHFMSLRHWIRLIELFFDISDRLISAHFHLKSELIIQKEYLISQIKTVPDDLEILVSHIKRKLYSLSYLRKDESLVMILDREYSHLREQMKSVSINPKINKYHAIFQEIFDDDYDYKNISLLLCEIIEELLSSDCKADQIRPVMNDMEDVRKILSLLEPFFEIPFCEAEKQKKILSTVATARERVTCFVCLSAVGKIDDEMVISLKNISSDLTIGEKQIMDMYLSLDVDSTENLQSHISMSLRLLWWNKRCYLGTELGEALEDHLTSIEHGLQYLVKIIKISENVGLKMRVLHLIDNVKRKLYSLPDSRNDENMKVNLEHAYGELREEMKNVVINPKTNYYDTLFPKFLTDPRQCLLLEEIMELTLLKLTSSNKANKIAPIMKEIIELRKKLISLKPLFDYARMKSGSFFSFTPEPEKLEVNVALTTFLDRATCFLYLSLVAKLDEDMFLSMKKNFSLLIDEIEIKKMFLDLGIIEDFDCDIDISLSLVKRHQEYHLYTINEAMLKDHLMSLQHGIEFLKWFFYIFNFDEDFKRCIRLLIGNVKTELVLLTYYQESLNITVKRKLDFLAASREKINVAIRQKADQYESQFPELHFYDTSLGKSMKAYLGRNYDFLSEKITTLVTANRKADRITPLTKELQELQKRLNFFKPLCLYICGMPRWRDEERIFQTLLTFLHKATFLIYLTFIGTMDMEMSGVSIAITETDDVQEIYKATFLMLTQFLSEGHYKVKELFLLENLMILLENNDESLNEPNCKLHKVLDDIHSFLLALPANVILRKLHLLKEPFEDILCHSIPIVYSCYHALTEEDIAAKFNCILDVIKHIKSVVLEMKLYYFPKVDNLGFLEFLLGYLEDLMKNQEILLKEKIDALHVEVNTLLSYAKSSNQELDKNPWNDIMNLAYQAEYIIDLYLVSSPRDMGLMSSLSKIIQQLHNISYVARDLSHLIESLPAQDVAAETSKSEVICLTTQARDNDGIVGWQKEIKNIMEDLLKGENKLNFVAIVGMAGVGKTTLALTIYNSPLVARRFDIRAQCAVSQSYQLRALLVSILDQVNASDNVTNMDDQDLADHFRRSLRRCRYLIVLDDVWDTSLLKVLKSCLPDDMKGSRILITTRNREVANQIESKVNELHGLSDENSWELFQIKMLKIECLSDDLLTISKGIVKNCKGLPLSIVIVAGILSTIERTEEKWNQIAKSVNSFVLSEAQGNCMAILELSYNHLPNHLRSCFLYLGSFPEDQEISVNRLILLWIGEGFIQDTEIDTAEEVANKYVEDLIVKSLLIPAKKRSRGGVKTFRLHDLLRDFCLGKAKEKQFFTLLSEEVLDNDETFSGINHPLALRDPRRIIINGPIETVDFWDSVRSMICHGKLDFLEMKKRIGSRDMVLLRVLEVHVAYSNPFSIDNFWEIHLEDVSSLVHLRYMAFHSGPIVDWNLVLPLSISKLQNLQILILQLYCFKVPDFIWDMVKLRHVHINEASFEVDSNRLQNSSVLLENLKSLCMAQVSYGDSKWLSKLPRLQRLYCLFTADDLEVDSDHASKDDVKDNQSRMLSFNAKTIDDAMKVDDVKDNQSPMLRFNKTLISLKVVNQTSGVQRFISTCQLPESLKKLTLSYFSLESNDISIIGETLTHLEVFKIYSCVVPSGYEWNVKDEDFPELKVLKLKDLKICKWTVSEDSFPNLEQLWLEKCDCLDKIPFKFGSLVKLRIISVEKCKLSVDKSAREIEKWQHEEQNTEMRVHISQKFILMY